MAKMTYSEKLKDPRWQKKRLEILQRDDWTCINCNRKDRTLHVHHKMYQYGKDVWDYPDENFLTLCHVCHSDVSYIKKDITGVIDKAFIYTSQLSDVHSILVDIAFLDLQEIRHIAHLVYEETKKLNKLKNG